MSKIEWNMTCFFIWRNWISGQRKNRPDVDRLKIWHWLLTKSGKAWFAFVTNQLKTKCFVTSPYVYVSNQAKSYDSKLTLIRFNRSFEDKAVELLLLGLLNQISIWKPVRIEWRGGLHAYVSVAICGASSLTVFIKCGKANMQCTFARSNV